MLHINFPIKCDSEEEGEKLVAKAGEGGQEEEGGEGRNSSAVRRDFISVGGARVRARAHLLAEVKGHFNWDD